MRRFGLFSLLFTGLCFPDLTWANDTVDLKYFCRVLAPGTTWTAEADNGLSYPGWVLFDKVIWQGEVQVSVNLDERRVGSWAHLPICSGSDQKQCHYEVSLKLLSEETLPRDVQQVKVLMIARTHKGPRLYAEASAYGMVAIRDYDGTEDLAADNNKSKVTQCYPENHPVFTSRDLRFTMNLSNSAADHQRLCEEVKNAMEEDWGNKIIELEVGRPFEGITQRSCRL